MDLKQLQYFVAIAEAGSITAAAKKLHLSQPPLSMQLKLLEEEMGTLLIERGSRSVTLTDAGRLLYRHAKQILTMADNALHDLADFNQGLRGTLRLGMVSSSVAPMLEHCIPLYHAQNPGIRFQIQEGTTFELLEILARNMIELAVVRTPFLDDGVVSHPLVPEPMAAAAKPAFFKGLPKGPLKACHLQGLPLIYYRRYETLLHAVMQARGVEADVLCLNDDARTTLLWAGAGLGVALLPLSACRSLTGELDVRPLDEVEWQISLAVIHRKGIALSRPARRFIETFESERQQ
ncbi:Cat operon transcriptional regulator [uncultured Clostridium sp.]|nr:Cat operon transcriptional regulator [uncultured Clostridium sp.]